jgi:hypothetical protein
MYRFVCTRMLMNLSEQEKNTKPHAHSQYCLAHSVSDATLLALLTLVRLQLRYTESQVFSVSLDPQTGNLRAEEFQTFPTVSAYDVEYAASASGAILMFAQEEEIVSPVYMWSRHSGRFVLQQVCSF